MNEQVIPIDSTSHIYLAKAYPWVDSLLYNPGKVSTLTYINLLLLGALLFAIFFLMRKMVIPLIKRRSIKSAFVRALPVVEAITALIFSIVSIFYLVLPYPLLGLIILGIVIAGTWGFLKDYFSGLLFRFSDNFHPGHRIKVGEQSGLIKHLGRLAVEREVENGELLIMPYNRLANTALLRETQSEKVLSYAFELDLPEKLKQPDPKAYLRNKILSLPWSVAAKDPFLEKVSVGDSRRYRVVLYALSEKYFPLMEEKLRKEV